MPEVMPDLAALVVPGRSIDHLTMLGAAPCMPHLLPARCSNPAAPSDARCIRDTPEPARTEAKGARKHGHTCSKAAAAPGDAADYRQQHLQDWVAGRRRLVLGRRGIAHPAPRGGQGDERVEVAVEAVLALVGRIMADVCLGQERASSRTAQPRRPTVFKSSADLRCNLEPAGQQGADGPGAGGVGPAEVGQHRHRHQRDHRTVVPGRNHDPSDFSLPYPHRPLVVAGSEQAPGGPGAGGVGPARVGQHRHRQHRNDRTRCPIKPPTSSPVARSNTLVPRLSTPTASRVRAGRAPGVSGQPGRGHSHRYQRRDRDRVPGQRPFGASGCY
jgi:hypothetical protein